MGYQDIEYELNGRCGLFICAASEPVLRCFRCRRQRVFDRPWQIIKNDPSAGAKQYIHEQEAESGRVPGMATVEVAHIELRFRLLANHLCKLPCVGPLCVDRGYAVFEIKC